MKRTKLAYQLVATAIATVAMGGNDLLAQDNNFPSARPTFNGVPFQSPPNPNFSPYQPTNGSVPPFYPNPGSISVPGTGYGEYAPAQFAPNYGPPGSFPNSGNSPEQMQERMNTEQKMRQWISKIQSSESEETEKTEAKSKLREAMLERFQKEQKLRKEKVEQLEEQLAKLKKQIAIREESFPKLVDLRIQLIEQDTNGDMPELSLTQPYPQNFPVPNGMPPVSPSIRGFGNSGTPYYNPGPNTVYGTQPGNFQSAQPFLNPPNSELPKKKNLNSTEPNSKPSPIKDKS